MDTTRNYGMKVIDVQGQSGLGSRLQRTISTKTFHYETVEYALGLLAYSNDARFTRRQIGIDTIINIVQESILSSDINFEEITINEDQLKEWARTIEHTWIKKIGAHYDHNPLDETEKNIYNKAEQEYIYHRPEYIYRCMVSIVIESHDGAAVIHTGDAHPLFIYQTEYAPMIHPQSKITWFGDPEDEGSSMFCQAIQLGRPRVIALLSDSLYRAMEPDYLTNIHKLLGYYPELAKHYIEAQMPLQAAKVNDEDLGIVLLFDQDPLAQSGNFPNISNLNIEEL